MPEEHRDADDTHHRERRRGVLGLRTPERLHAVRDRLDARQRRGPGRERAEDQEQAERLHHRELRSAVAATGQPPRHSRNPTTSVTNDHQHEPVRRDREQRPRLLHAAEVRDRDQQDEGRSRSRPARLDRRRGRDDRDRAGRDRHRDGEHVVGQDRRGGDQPRYRAEVLLRHDVRAAAARVRAHRLPVRRDDDQPAGAAIASADREHQRERRRARQWRARASSPRWRTRPRRAASEEKTGSARNLGRSWCSALLRRERPPEEQPFTRRGEPGFVRRRHRAGF